MELRINEITVPENIVFNYEELRAELIAKTEAYETVVYSDEQIKQAKADRAALNKLKSALNDERIRREREYMKPFNDFKAKVDDLITIIGKPIAAIDRQIKEAEAKEREEKAQKIEALFDSIKARPEWLELKQIWDDRWLNKGVTFRMIEDNIRGWCGRIDTELRTISELPTGAYEATEEYKRTLDLGKAITEGKRIAEIQRRKEEQARKDGEQMAEAYKNAVENDRDFPTQEDIDEVNAIVEEMANNADVEEPAEWIRFEALLTYGQAIKLRHFCHDNGINLKAI